MAVQCSARIHKNDHAKTLATGFTIQALSHPFSAWNLDINILKISSIAPRMAPFPAAPPPRPSFFPAAAIFWWIRRLPCGRRMRYDAHLPGLTKFLSWWQCQQQMMETTIIDRSSSQNSQVLLSFASSASLWEKEGGKGWDTTPPWFDKIDQNW